MNKICLMVNNVNDLKTNVDSFIIGLKNYNSLNIKEFDINEIKNIKCSKELIISINKVIHNNEIDNLIDILKQLEGFKIIFDDFSIIQIVKDYKLNIDLIWGNLRATTSYNSINEINKYGVNYSILSPDITIDEMFEIKNNTSVKLFLPVYGKFNIFSSNRFLITNYLKYIGKEKKDTKYKIGNKELYYDIYEDNNGTHIVNSKCTNGIIDYKNILDNNIDYILINSYDINYDINELINSFITIRNLYYQDLLDLKTLVKFHNNYTNINTDSGFLHKKSIYKVGDSNE